jgi:gamma-glutamylcysteine synthetase
VSSFLHLGVFGSQIWTDVDNNRTGDLPFVFKGDFGYALGYYFDYHILLRHVHLHCGN